MTSTTRTQRRYDHRLPKASGNETNRRGVNMGRDLGQTQRESVEFWVLWAEIGILAGFSESLSRRESWRSQGSSRGFLGENKECKTPRDEPSAFRVNRWSSSSATKPKAPRTQRFKKPFSKSHFQRVLRRKYLSDFETNSVSPKPKATVANFAH